MSTIDVYDKKILYALDCNARQSAQQIARKVRLSKVAVINRINKLVKEKVIAEFITLVNYRKLGYTNYHVYYSLHNLSQKKEEEFINYLCNEHEIRYILQFDSRWDLMLALYTKSSEETDKILNRIHEKFGILIKEIRVFTIITTFYPGRVYLNNTNSQLVRVPLVREQTAYEEIDLIDKKILRGIAHNARISLVDLEKNIRVKTDIIRYRLKNLTQRGIIQRYTINLNTAVYGNLLYKVLFTLNPSLKEETLMSELSQEKYTHRAHHFMGEKIVEADFEVPEYTDLRELLRNIKAKFADKITAIDILPVYTIRKMEYNPL